MKRFIGILLFVGAVALIDHGITQSNSPVTVTMLSPTNGAIVSNTITLSAVASSSVAPIVKVEFYRDGVLIGTVYRTPPPENLQVSK